MHDPEGANNWDFNDSYAAMLIYKNISVAQKVHTGQDNLAYEVWKNLEAMHKVMGHTTVITWICTLFKCTAEEGNDILQHLNNLKVNWEHINVLSLEDFKISDLFFKIIISSLLPPSWDNFTQAYIAKVRRHTTHNPFKNMSSQEFIGVIKAEVEHRLKQHTGDLTNFATSLKAKNNKGKGKPSLLKCIMLKLKDLKMNDNNKEKLDKKVKPYCKHCKMKGHTANNCDKWNEDPCIHCRCFNHESDDCWHKDKLKQEKKNKGKSNPCKRARIKETNATDSDSQHLRVTIKEIGDVTPGGITFDASECGQYFNFENHNVTNFNGIDERTLYYVWLADSAMTSHIVN